MSLLVFDIGVTKTRVAINRRGPRLDRVHVFPTPAKYHRGLQKLTETALSSLGGRRPRLAVGGFAGPLDARHRRILDCQSPDWIHRPLADDLARRLKTKVRLENDAALNGLGEAVAGAGRGRSIVGFLTVSTGTNGVRIVDGRIDRNAMGFELRHLLVPDDKGRLTTLGRVVSGRAIETRWHTKPGDIRSRRVWGRLSEVLAYALVNLMVAWSPELMILGGGLVRPSALRLGDVRRAARRLWRMPKPMPPIVAGKLGDRSGLYGALALANERR
ncbi:MAG: ROK family protein [Candidatus Kerfeldbacteria bacterium]|nr:ROK family protein [Candidatus Kerfeldbacteria bacterium]